MTRRRLLIATDNFMPRWDGITRFLSEIIPRLKEHYDITVVAPDFGPYEDEGITLIKIPLFRALTFGDFTLAQVRYFRIRKAIRKADVVFTQTIGPIGMLSALIAHKLHKPVACFIHSIETELVPHAVSGIWRKYAYPLMRRLTRHVYSRADLLIVPAESVADVLSWNRIDRRTEVVYLGTDTKKFAPPSSKTAAKQALGFQSDDIIIGYHGRISREKDLITLFRAFIRLQSRYPKIHLVIVGNGLESIRRRMALRPGVHVYPAQDDVLPFLHAFDIYALTSLTETTSLSTLEAMSCGIPVVVTRVGFLKDYIINNINGLLFDKKNVYHLAKQLEKLINNPDLRKKIGEQGRKTVIQRFDWNVTAREIEVLLGNL